MNQANYNTAFLDKVGVFSVRLYNNKGVVAAVRALITLDIMFVLIHNGVI